MHNYLKMASKSWPEINWILSLYRRIYTAQLAAVTHFVIIKKLSVLGVVFMNGKNLQMEENIVWSGDAKLNPPLNPLASLSSLPPNPEDSINHFKQNIYNQRYLGIFGYNHIIYIDLSSRFTKAKEEFISSLT